MKTYKDNEYDIFIPLGECCVVAHQLRRRNLRFCALPFDWFLYNSEESFKHVVECFKTDFKNFMIYENLEKIEDTESSYYDNYNEFKLLHAFKKTIDDKKYFRHVKSIFDKRINRLFTLLNKSNKIMFIVATSFPLDIQYLKDFANYISERYNTEVKITWLNFNSSENSTIEDGNIICYKIQRSLNNYDHFGMNNEWAFLDDVRLSKLLRPWLKFECNKKSFILNILPIINTLLKIELYIFGFRVKICIGRNRDYQFNYYY